MSEYTFYDLWNEIVGWNENVGWKDEYIRWLLSKPKWWQFRKRRKWKKAMPPMGGADHDDLQGACGAVCAAGILRRERGVNHLFKKLKKKFTKALTRVEVRYCEWFYCDGVEVKESNFKQGRKYICFPDGLRIIIEEDGFDNDGFDMKYVGFYTQEPNKEG